MANTFKNAIIKNIGTQKIEAILTQTGVNATVIGMSFANVTEFPVEIDVLIKDDSSVEGYYLKGVSIPANGSLKPMLGGEKIIIPSDYSLLVKSNLTDSVDAIISYVDIS